MIVRLICDKCEHAEFIIKTTDQKYFKCPYSKQIYSHDNECQLEKRIMKINKPT